MVVDLLGFSFQTHFPQAEVEGCGRFVPLQCSLVDALGPPWPCNHTEPGGEAGRTPYLLVLTPSFYLTSVTLIAGLVQSEATITFDFFWLKSLIMLDFCYFRFSAAPFYNIFSMSTQQRLKGSLYDVLWCSVEMGQSYCTE